MAGINVVWKAGRRLSKLVFLPTSPDGSPLYTCGSVSQKHVDSMPSQAIKGSTIAVDPKYSCDRVEIPTHVRAVSGRKASSAKMHAQVKATQLLGCATVAVKL